MGNVVSVEMGKIVASRLDAVHHTLRSYQASSMFSTRHLETWRQRLCAKLIVLFGSDGITPSFWHEYLPPALARAALAVSNNRDRDVDGAAFYTLETKVFQLNTDCLEAQHVQPDSAAIYRTVGVATREQLLNHASTLRNLARPPQRGLQDMMIQSTLTQQPYQPLTERQDDAEKQQLPCALTSTMSLSLSPKITPIRFLRPQKGTRSVTARCLAAVPFSASRSAVTRPSSYFILSILGQKSVNIKPIMRHAQKRSKPPGHAAGTFPNHFNNYRRKLAGGWKSAVRQPSEPTRCKCKGERNKKDRKDQALAYRHHELRGGGGDNAQLNAGKCREQIPSHPITFGKYTFSLASIKPRCIPIDLSFPTLSNSSWGLDLFPSPPPSCLRPLAACGLQRKPGISGSALTDLSLLQETKNKVFNQFLIMPNPTVCIHCIETARELIPRYPEKDRITLVGAHNDRYEEPKPANRSRGRMRKRLANLCPFQ
ncbi:uncharacterized protein CLUP02_11980 [Colletotrichum lupini]|uniref:Uncharacterized protein n=1 Tax=Colletotrichum lupini TaxID=145971 RepID=A0A9Q8SZI2_9PEZI|nr:uncharacterized protein CLUP02_11980 [Colletotrichum lupini]UQC86479.1 hypothetical protein CLUP02_11980 [Colletotrichum lupini]